MYRPLTMVIGATRWYNRVTNRYFIRRLQHRRGNYRLFFEYGMRCLSSTRYKFLLCLSFDLQTRCVQFRTIFELSRRQFIDEWLELVVIRIQNASIVHNCLLLLLLFFFLYFDLTRLKLIELLVLRPSVILNPHVRLIFLRIGPKLDVTRDLIGGMPYKCIFISKFTLPFII